MPSVEVLAERFRMLPEDVGLSAAGSLIGFLHPGQGVAGLRRKWQQSLRAALPDSAAEAAWRAHLESTPPATLDVSRLMLEGC